MPNSETSTQESQFSDLKMPLHAAIITLCALVCLTPSIAAVAPRALGFIPAVSGVIFLLAVRLWGGHWPPLNRLYIAIALGTGLLAALSSLWALNADVALERGVKILILLGGGCALFALLRLNISWPRFLYWGFPIGVLCAGLFCVFELYTNGVLYNAWRGTDPAKYNPSVVNRATVSFILLLAPALCFLGLSSCSRTQKRLIQILFLLVTIVMACMTQSQSAHLALLTIAILWFGFLVFRLKAAQYTLMALMCAGILAGPWLVQFLYDTAAEHLHTMPWFANAYAADRLEIWDFVARKALENPLYGFGIEATRHIEQFDTPMRYTPLDHVLHPHNAVLQVWIEFGLVGALGLCAAVILILRSIFKLENEQSQRLCLSVFIAAFVMACTSYGLWQGWWLGLFTMVVALCGHLTAQQKGRF